MSVPQSSVEFVLILSRAHSCYRPNAGTFALADSPSRTQSARCSLVIRYPEPVTVSITLFASFSRARLTRISVVDRARVRLTHNSWCLAHPRKRATGGSFPHGLVDDRRFGRLRDNVRRFRGDPSTGQHCFNNAGFEHCGYCVA